MTHEDRWLRAATEYVQKLRFSVFPVGKDKRPRLPWKEYQTRRPTQGELAAWPKENLAIITGAISNIVVLDCESREDAEWCDKEYALHRETPLVQTRRGFHFYLQHPEVWVHNRRQANGRYDVRGDGGYVLAPPSQHSEGEYTWIRPARDPRTIRRFDPDWAPAPRHNGKPPGEIRDVLAYIRTIRAISGQGGHNATYRVTSLLYEAGLAESEAMLALLDWNRTNAEPPWSDRELVHKIREVYGG